VPLLQALDLERNVAQRREDEAPREFARGGVRIVCMARAVAGSGDHDAVLGAGRDVEVIDVATGLADEFKLRQLLDDRAREGHPLLREHQRIAARHLLHDPLGIGVGVGVDDDLVPFQLVVSARFPKCICVIMYDCDLHGGSLFVTRCSSFVSR
jgi:hypothetical protein